MCGNLKKLIFPLGMVLLTAFLIIFSIATPVAARSLEIYQVEITAEVLPNGDLKVVEQRTINFNGQFRGADHKIYFNEIELFSEITIREGANLYTLVDQFPTSEPGTYAIRVFGEDYFMVDWSFDAYNEQRIFTLEYIARDAIVVHNDVAELYYKFVGDEWEFPAGSVRVTLTLPAGAEDGEVLAWGHGPAHGEVMIDSLEKITWYVAPLAERTFLEGRAVFPRELVSESTRLSGKEALDSIIAEEKRWAAQSNISRAVKIYQPIYSLLLFILVGLGLFSMWSKAANKSKAYQGDYFRELPGNYPPEVAGYLWHKKKIQNESLAAGILDLARRSHLQIEPLQNLSSTSKAKNDDFQLIELKNEEVKSSVDKIVVEFLFGPVYLEFKPESEVDLVVNAKKSISFSQIQDFATKKPREFHKFHTEWKSTVERLGKGQMFFAEKSSLIGCLLPFVMICAGVVVMILGELFLFGAALIVGALLLFFASPKLYYTAYGADQLAKWNAFRRFLLHFSKVDQSTVPSLVVWEHYLVYAVILGVAKQVIDQLALVFPRLEQDPTINQTSWSRMNAAQTALIINNMNTMTRSLNNTVSSASRTASSAIAAASSTSSARSSGGFSSGGGFGGGFSGGGGGGFGGGGGSFR